MATDPAESAARYDALWHEPWALVQAIGPLTRSRYRLILAEVEQRLTPASRVLDAGCGNGTLLGKLASRHPISLLHGIELSAEAIAAASPTVRPRIAHGELASQLPNFFDAPVDILISSEVLEHVTDPLESLRIMRRALKDCGVAVFTVPSGMKWWSSQDVFAGHVQRFEPEDFSGMLSSAGFRLVELYCWGIGPALVYDRITSWIGPQRAISAGGSRLGRLTASGLYHLFKMEDGLRSRHGFQLIAVAESE